MKAKPRRRRREEREPFPGAARAPPDSRRESRARNRRVPRRKLRRRRCRSLQNAPIIPPLSVPVAPSWKQEQKNERACHCHPLQGRRLPRVLRRRPRVPCRRPRAPCRRFADEKQEGGRVVMLMPKKVKFRKQQRGRMTGKAWRGSSLAFGEFGLKSFALRLGDESPN